MLIRSPLVVAMLLTATAVAHGRDYFLTIGGGGSPTGNQVSLEKNVLFFLRVREALGLADTRHDILFSDGDDPGRDLQFHDPDYPVSDANLLLAQICSREDGFWDHYRTHQVPGTRGPSSREHIERCFDELVDELTPGDRLLVYFTGHGGKGGEGDSNYLHLWNGDKLTVQDFVAQLDRLPREVPVTVVMVQCYSGGFANLVFNAADSARGVSAAPRCGFFATTHDRVAAGCTSDIDEESYQEYSSFFWAALAGEKRLGESIERPDYDGDGRTSFEEAHAYTLLESNTIDVCVRTSDALLRSLSKTAHDRRTDLLTPDSPRASILAAASPVDRAVLLGLESQLALGNGWLTQARNGVEDAKKRKAALDKQKSRAVAAQKKLAGEIFSSLKSRWPELENPWHPRVQEILTVESATLLRTIQAHPKFSEFQRKQDEVAGFAERSLQARRDGAKLQRFVNTVERVALEANLPKVASPADVERYQQILSYERADLTSWPIPKVVVRPADY